MTRTFTCIICPNGCEITAEYEGTDVRSIEGATCPKGQDYVRQELTDPRRNIATSIPVECGELPLVKKDIFTVMDAINKLHVKAPTAIGQVVLPDVCGLGANVIITKNVAAL